MVSAEVQGDAVLKIVRKTEKTESPKDHSQNSAVLSDFLTSGLSVLFKIRFHHPQHIAAKNFFNGPVGVTSSF